MQASINDRKQSIQSGVLRRSTGPGINSTTDVNVPNEFPNMMNNMHNARKRNSTAVGSGAAARYRRYSVASLQLWAPPMTGRSSISETIQEVDTDNTDVEFEEECPILYKINDSPPFYLTLFFAFQQSLISIVGSIVLPLLVAEAACALENGVFIRKLVSSTLLLSGVTTFLQVMFGIRLPVYQGPSGSYSVPIIALNKIDPGRCDIHTMFPGALNSTSNNITEADLQEQLIDIRVREMMGPLILAGFLHFLVGVTGLVGMLQRFVGPITIVPTILLIGLYIVKPAMVYTEVHWGISFITWATGVVLSMYLGHKPMIIPVWTRKEGFHTIRYPLHQVFAILFSILIGWAVCGIMTAAGAFPTDKTNIQYKARTDARADVIADSEWFYLPHPGQFGLPLFSVSAIIGFLIATITSILDSIGDYYATAAICRVPPPPSHGINRGIAIEGFCSMISGLFGVGHATTTYGGNIGAIGMTRVASRHVFIAMSGMYVALGVLAKVSAVIISIPYPVLGGVLITIIGVFVGVNLSNLNVIDLASTRNLSIIGTAVFVGFLVPTWMEKNGSVIDTGNRDLDQVITMFLGNPNFLGGFIACFMDNTIPGTDEERGIAAWKNPESLDNSTNFIEGQEVYEPLIPECLKRQRFLRFIPIFPKYDRNIGKKDGTRNEGFAEDSNNEMNSKV
ncbi:solute carrier family 23 member 1-like [Mercenaria mercenaria]|uniref:solute carrier family 23 member 1-like n=1 Tax=Mercenaria mercenaria TaxID=6596 RepID=UPI00234EFEC4|nr:solute carrier family 23 member 1-like [Mercenaria mercenaria]